MIFIGHLLGCSPAIIRSHNFPPKRHDGLGYNTIILQNPEHRVANYHKKYVIAIF